MPKKERNIKHRLAGTTALIGAAMIAFPNAAQSADTDIVISAPTAATQNLDTRDTLTVNAGGSISAQPGVTVNGVDATSITNSGTISDGGGSTAILIDNTGNITGGITNSGAISANRTGIKVDNNSNISGGIDNSGSINFNRTGIMVINSSDISGGIDNSGTITGGDTAILVDSNSDISGGIINSGTITGTDIVIYVDNSSDISGGINNSGTISASSTYVIYVDGNSDISGGITNSGTISGDSYYTIWVDNSSDISGGINNSGTIFNGSYYAIYVDDSSDISGGITNSGTISNSSSAAILVSDSDISGGINNSGNIIAGDEAIYIYDSNMTGAIINSGTISGDEGILIEGTADVSGGIVNSGIIDGSNGGIVLRSNSDMTGSITNSGTISANDVGLDLRSNSDIIGGLTNSGTISGNTIGMAVRTASDISGGVNNSGTISGVNVGVAIITSADISGGIDNSGTISGNIGIRTIVFSDMTGQITNSGTISGNTYGIFIANNSDISGGIANSGTISGGNTGIYVRVNSDISGGITNTGTISGNFGIRATNTSNITGGITNTGTIEGTGGTAIRLVGLTAATPINLNGGRVIGDITDTTPANGFSVVTVGGDFAAENDITVSDLTVTAGNEFTINFGDTVTLNDMSTSAGTFTFQVDTAASFGDLAVTNGDVDLTGATVAVDVEAGTLTLGDEIQVATGNAALTGTGGGAGQTLTTVSDNSLSWSFQIADGGQAGITGSADNTSLFLLVGAGSTAVAEADDINNQAVGAIFDTLIGSTADTELLQVIDQINTNSSDNAALNNVLEGTQPGINGGEVAASVNFSDANLSLASQRLADLRDPGGGATQFASVGGRVGGSIGSKLTDIASGNIANGGLHTASSLNSLNTASGHGEGLKTWGQVFGQTADQGTRNNIAGYDANTIGLAAGVDTENLITDGVVGLSVSYGYTKVDSDNATTTDTDVNSYQLTLYGDQNLGGNVHINGMVGYAYNDIDATRNNVGGVPGLNADADYAAHEFTIRTEIGKDHKHSGNQTITPTINAQWTHYRPEDYTETGAGGANLNVQGKSLDIVRLGVGIENKWDIENDDGSKLEPEIRAGYSYDVIGDTVETTSRFTGGGGSFTSAGFEPAQHSINAGAGVTYYADDKWEVSTDYDFEYKSNYTAHSGKLNIGYKF